MKDTYIKLFIGVLLLGTWIALVVFKVPDADDLIECIKAALMGLGVYHMGQTVPSGFSSNKQGGFVRVPFLLMMAMMGLLAASVGACVTPTQEQATKTLTPVAYVQACSGYGIALQTAVQLRQEGALNQAQIDQVTLIDSQITPLCTGAMPTDPNLFIQKVTAAVTTLTILEIANREK